jgi:hypothetical protein
MSFALPKPDRAEIQKRLDFQKRNWLGQIQLSHTQHPFSFDAFVNIHVSHSLIRLALPELIG